MEAPVVPLENNKVTTSSLGLIFTSLGNAVPSSAKREETDSKFSDCPMTKTEQTFSRTPLLTAFWARSGEVTRKFALEIFRKRQSSSRVHWGFSVVTTPPRFAAPWKIIGYSITFGRYIAMTSPFLKPLFASAELKRRVLSLSSAKVINLPEKASICIRQICSLDQQRTPASDS